MKSKKNILYIILLTVGIILLVNYLSNRFFLRLDFTEDNRYTLNRATKNILRNIEEPVTITAYFSGNLPPQLDQVKREFRDMLIEYTNVSKHMIAYEFIDPLKDEKIKAEAQRAGVMPFQVQVREKDQLKAQLAFMGAVVQYGENDEIIPVIQTSEGLEYKLSSTIKKLTVVNKPLIGIVQGHGEANFGKIWQAKQGLDVLYKTELVDLNDSLLQPDKFITLIILGTTDSFPAAHLQKLDEFLFRGGRMFIALNRVNVDMNQNPYTYPVNTGLETWLRQKGIDIEDNLVIDDNCLQVGVQVQQGFYMQIPFPYFIRVNEFSEHPVSSGLEEIYLQFASPVNFSGDSSLTFTPLLLSSEKSGVQPSQSYIDVMHEWSDADYPVSGLTLAAAVEGKFGNGANTKMVVVGDADFIIPGEQQGQVNPDNVSLFVNAVDWLSDDTGLVALRTQGATSRPLETIEDGKRTFLKYLNFLLPVFLAMAYGIFRFQRNRVIRQRRKEGMYV